MALAHSFYAEQPAVLGRLEEARRRRLDVLDFYGSSPDGAFEVAARSYSLAKLALIDGDIQAAERHYRAATEGFGRLDRPVMNSMCLGMVADFDERAGDYPAAIRRLEAAIETNESLLGGFTGSLQAHLGWVLLQDGQGARAEAVFENALDSARRVRHTMVLFQAQAGLAAIHRLEGRPDDAVAAASEALDIYRAGGFRRFRNRVHPTSDLQAAAAVCCEVLAATLAERGEPNDAAKLLADADRLRTESGLATPAVLRDVVAVARAAACAAPGADG
jgi:tetratricopeptide (TPR) repeat protein